MIGCPQTEQRLQKGPLSWHRHDAAYATLVLEGSYIERGMAGRWTVEPGDVLFHKGFDAHDNLVCRVRTTVLNVPLPAATSLPPVFTVADPDGLVTAVRTGTRDLGPLLRPERIVPRQYHDWPDRLAAALAEDSIELSAWARAAGLDPASVSRGFRLAFGLLPSAYRAEARTSRALRAIAQGLPLAQAAASSGFADQAHLTRCVKRATGHPPARWRRVKSVQ